MSADKNWPAYGDDGVAITANSTATAVLIADTGIERTGEDVMVYNPGPLTVNIKVGNTASVVATALSIPVPPQTLSPYRKGTGNNYLSAYCSGSQQIVVFCGEGA